METFMREKKSMNLRIYGPSFEANTMDPTPENIPELIRERAYQLFMGRGRKSGHELDDWLQAEREIRRQYGI
jgi:Protein of unknown function (DUF2934)